MKKLKYIIIAIIVICYSLGCNNQNSKNISFLQVKQTATSKIEENSKNIDNTSLEQTIINWATAYCNKDGNTLYKLFDPDNKEDFFCIENVNSLEYESIIDFGSLGAWPRDNNYDYSINGDSVEITYYAMTTKPHVYIWVEYLTIEEKNGLYYVVSERMKQYNEVTNKKDLIESVKGNFEYTGNEINYMMTGLAYQLNQNALKERKGVYANLFSPERAAPYLLNLSGGNCKVKIQSDTYTFVTYKFKDGVSIDIQMKQPFGPNGIWLVKDVDVEYKEKHLIEVEKWFQNISIEDLNEIKSVVSLYEVAEMSDENILLLASLPKENIYLYGYRNYGTILRVGDYYELFDWAYIAPVAVLPKIAYTDCDNDGKREIVVSLHLGTGIGVSIDCLYIVKTREDGSFWEMRFTPYQYMKQLKERVTTEYDHQNASLQFYIDNEKVGHSVDFTSWKEEGNNFIKIGFGDQIAFEVNKAGITLNAKPGFYLEQGVTAQFDRMPNITAKVLYLNGSPLLTELEFSENCD